ncbi:nucleoside-diphosphate-sugar epimerase [Stackebrandtia albiflava]|uniref:Nucleoside-diphosphate-sugar epimerase n=1 Tax=Stackebrandtia albiflava TaxID=406432 RepID=A0A562VGG0_9ACTN|nr:NAD-dependent epimerase/dehydratase family protein [Stackebrandtia albiflava]TWJ16904.1 nucleoside-diphosphate-sugar epimerase [Stackebrandtia albiflava]
MPNHVILGKGQVGSTVAAILASRGEQVRVLSRSGGIDRPGIRHLAVDAGDRDALLAACRGADVIYNCANPSGYHRWAAEWPPVAAALLDAAEAEQAGLVITGNLYGYAPDRRYMTADTPLDTAGAKGAIRARMWDEAVARHRAGRVRVTEVRASDYFGPGALANAMIGERFMRPLIEGRSVSVFGDPDAPHSFSYIPDVARALVRVGGDDRSWGRAWHVPTAPPRSSRQMADAVRRLAGHDGPAKVSRVPWWFVIGVMGAFRPHLRGMAETRHQWDAPYVMDSSDFTGTFGDEPTGTDEALTETIRWWRERAAGA